MAGDVARWSGRLAAALRDRHGVTRGERVALLHDDGRVQVLGRTSVDILESAGYKLSAIAIEEALRAHPDVRDAAVVGLPDETYGQRVAAAVMLRPDAALTAEALLAFAREALPPYALPRLLRFVDDVPRNAMGKVRKPALAEELARCEAGAAAGRGDTAPERRRAGSNSSR